MGPGDALEFHAGEVRNVSAVVDCGCTPENWVHVQQDGKTGTCQRCGRDVQTTRVKPGGMAFVGPYLERKPRWQRRTERFGRIRAGK